MDRYRVCPTCDHFAHADEEDRCCIKCGVPLLDGCPSCGAAIANPYARHCAACGVRVRTAASRAFGHRRSGERQIVRRRARLSIRLDGAGRVIEVGSATIADMSETGVRLRDMDLPSGSLPLAPFSVEIEMLDGPDEGRKFIGRVVRLATGGQMELGVESLTAEDVPGNAALRATGAAPAREDVANCAPPRSGRSRRARKERGA